MRPSLRYPIFFLLCPLLGFTQLSKAEIDSLIYYKSTELRKEAKYEEVIALSKKVIAYSEKINYAAGIAWSNKAIGNSLSNLGRFKESLHYLTLAQQQSEKIDDYELKAVIAIEIGKNYNDQKVSFHEAIKEFKRGARFAAKIKDDYKRETQLLYSYESQASAYYNLNLPDSAQLYLLKSFKIEKDVYSASALIYYHLYFSKNADSVRYYLDLSDRLLKSHPTDFFEKTVFHNQWALYYTLKKDYNLALKSYKEGLFYASKGQFMQEKANAFLGISQCYEQLGKTTESLRYMKEYGILQDSISKAYVKEVGHSVDSIVEKQHDSHKERVSGLQWVLILAVTVALLIIVVILYFFKRNSKKRKSLIEKSQYLLSEREQELQSIQRKVNPAFENLLELVKSNHPNFYVRFQEAYPEFQEKLLAINPNLEVSELTLCACIYLDFQTKEIAYYWLKSVRTIQTRKNRLRKRLDIPSSDDLYVWMKKNTK